MADVLVRLLHIAGQEAQAAYSARDAIEAARQQAPDVVLCDIGLPDGMTGYDVARALRAETVTRDALLVALTGYGRAEDRQEAVAAGFDAHLTKPVDLAAIESVVAAGRP
jgi:CheY-like chemotaxis protein